MGQGLKRRAKSGGRWCETPFHNKFHHKLKYAAFKFRRRVERAKAVSVSRQCAINKKTAAGEFSC